MSVYNALLDLPIEQRMKIADDMTFEQKKAMLIELDALEKEQCKDLRMFVKYAWSSIDPAPFIPNWHIDAICDHLQAVTDGDIRRLIINIPPRAMKSLTASVFWPAWEWAIHNPAQQWIYASHNQILSRELSVKCRGVIKSDWYRGHWGNEVQILDDQDTQGKFVNTARGSRQATSIGGNVTGFGGNRLIVDDPLDASEESSPVSRDKANTWWSETMSTRMNHPALAAKVIIMQRLHENDLTGYLLAKDQGYEHLMLPMRYESNHPHLSKTSLNFFDPRTIDGELLFPERVPEEDLKELEKDMGAYSVAGQLQQRPAPRDSGMFKREWFEIIDKIPNKIRHTCRHWDLASTEKRAGNDPDWTVGLKLVMDSKGVFYIVDIRRFRESSQFVENSIKTGALQDGRTTIISLPQDPGQAGVVQANYYRTELAGSFANRVVIDRESGNKITRAQPVESQAQAGNIKIIRDVTWNDTFLNELETFPNGRYKDQVDALSGAFAVLIKYRKKMGDFSLPGLTQKSTWARHR